MKDVPVKLGPLALLLTVISICMTVLAILAFTTARADLSLARTYAETVRERYSLEILGQQYLQETADDLSQGIILMPDADGMVHETIEQGSMKLDIALQPKGASGFRIGSWRVERRWVEDTDIGNLWDGTWN